MDFAAEKNGTLATEGEKDVIGLLACALARSQPLSLASNLRYIEWFGESLCAAAKDYAEAYKKLKSAAGLMQSVPLPKVSDMTN